MELRNPELLRSQCFAAGTWFANKKSAQTTVINPATEESIGTVPQVDSAETEAAIAAASAAWNSWKSTSAAKRSALLHEWQQLIRTHLDDLAVIMTSEQGKPLAESRGKFSTVPTISSGMQKKPNASTEKPSQVISQTLDL